MRSVAGRTSLLEVFELERQEEDWIAWEFQQLEVELELQVAVEEVLVSASRRLEEE